MKHNILNIIYGVIIAAMPILSACGHHDEPVAPDNPPVNPPVEEISTPRTILVYMVASNNLGSGGFDKSDINEMCEAMQNGDNKGGRLLIYHATSKGSMIKEIKAEGIDTLQVYDTEDLSVSIKRMRTVIDDVKTLAPAKDYGLVLWSHASGWYQDGIDDDWVDVNSVNPAAQNVNQPYSPVLYSFGSDGSTKAKKMNITSLRDALKDAGLSFIYFDCCFMGSVEALYELRDCAQYFIASPAEIDADGMPYHENLKYLFDTEYSVEDIMVNAAKSTFDYYKARMFDSKDNYIENSCPCTMTVVRADKLASLAQATKAIYAVAPESYKPLYKYQKYSTSSKYMYYDFGDYIETLEVDNPDLLLAWREAMDKAVVYTEATPYIWTSNYPLKKYSGLSTYILMTSGSAETNNYYTLSWYDDVAAYVIK